MGVIVQYIEVLFLAVEVVEDFIVIFSINGIANCKDYLVVITSILPHDPPCECVEVFLFE